jgi:dCTP deaminase
MILTGPEIEAQVQAGRITIDPFDRARVNPNSYNYSLGSDYIELDRSRRHDGDSARTVEPRPIPAQGLTLTPGHLYLCHTQERLGSAYYVTSLIGKSSMGRLGLFLQISADLGHQEQIHQWTLELRACLPVRIYPGMVIGQVTFWATKGKPLPKQGYYGRFDGPTPSKGFA